MQDDSFGQRKYAGVLEAENLALIAIFGLLVFFVTMTGLVVYSLCGGRETAAAAAAAAEVQASSRQQQQRSWASLATVLMLALIRMERNEQRMESIEEELII